MTNKHKPQQKKVVVLNKTQMKNKKLREGFKSGGACVAENKPVKPQDWKKVIKALNEK